MGEPTRLRAHFGDIIENGWASESNPTRVGYFVREGRRTGRMNAGLYFEVTDGNGKFWELPVDRDHKITVRPAARSDTGEVEKRAEWAEGQWRLLETANREAQARAEAAEAQLSAAADNSEEFERLFYAERDRAEAAEAQVSRKDAEIEALRLALSWLEPKLIEGEDETWLRKRIALVNADVARFDRARSALEDHQPAGDPS